MNKLFDRDNLKILPLSSRVNKLNIEQDVVDPSTWLLDLSNEAMEDVEKTAENLRRAKRDGAARILTYGAHSIKNGLGKVLARLAEKGWLTHLVTNGAGVIHDWEFAYQGRSGEDVQRYAAEGQFGIWDETGRYINLAIVVGAYNGLGYGESVGEMILKEGLEIPSDEELKYAMLSGVECANFPPAPREVLDADQDSQAEILDHAAAAADLLRAKRRFNLSDGWNRIPHPYQDYSVAYHLRRNKILFGCCPMIGCDIIYTHPANRCSAIGRAAERDFLSFANSVSQLEGGVYLSVGSAVLSPMIFEKSIKISPLNTFYHMPQNKTIKKVGDYCTKITD